MADEGARGLVFGNFPTAEQHSEPEVYGAAQAKFEAARIMKDAKCYHFMSDYRKCIMATNMFRQYYIHGKYPSCKMHSQRIKHCFMWKSMGKHSELGKKKLTESLENEQLNMHTPNPVWKMRDRPLEDWYKPTER